LDEFSLNSHDEERGNISIHTEIAQPASLLNDMNQAFVMYIKNIFVVATDLADEKVENAEYCEIVQRGLEALKAIFDHPKGVRLRIDRERSIFQEAFGKILEDTGSADMT
jgi:hypothetical protein